MRPVYLRQVLGELNGIAKAVADGAIDDPSWLRVAIPRYGSPPFPGGLQNPLNAELCQECRWCHCRRACRRVVRSRLKPIRASLMSVGLKVCV